MLNPYRNFQTQAKIDAPHNLALTLANTDSGSLLSSEQRKDFRKIQF
jgi:hypothetical protein